MFGTNHIQIGECNNCFIIVIKFIKEVEDILNATRVSDKQHDKIKQKIKWVVAKCTSSKTIQGALFEYAEDRGQIHWVGLPQV